MNWNPQKAAVNRIRGLSYHIASQKEKKINQFYSAIHLCVWPQESTQLNKLKCISWNVFMLSKAINQYKWKRKKNPKP